EIDMEIAALLPIAYVHLPKATGTCHRLAVSISLLTGAVEDAATGELASAMQRIGELSMEVELLSSRIERLGPLVRRRLRCWRQRPPQPPVAATASPRS